MRALPPSTSGWHDSDIHSSLTYTQFDYLLLVNSPALWDSLPRALPHLLLYLHHGHIHLLSPLWFCNLTSLFIWSGSASQPDPGRLISSPTRDFAKRHECVYFLLLIEIPLYFYFSKTFTDDEYFNFYTKKLLLMYMWVKSESGAKIPFHS